MQGRQLQRIPDVISAWLELCKHDRYGVEGRGAYHQMARGSHNQVESVELKISML